MGGVDHLAQAAAEPVHLPHHQLVFGTQVGEGGLERRSLGPGPARLFLLEDLLASGLAERVALQVEVLVLGRDAGVADQHVWLVQLDRMSGNRFQDIFSGQKSWAGGGGSAGLRNVSRKRPFSGWRS